MQAEQEQEQEAQRESADIPPPSPPRPTIMRGAAILAFGNIVSRVLGLARDSVIVRLFGADLASAYETAVLIPNNLFDAIKGGMVDSALVPVFSDMAGRERREILQAAVSAFMSVAIVFLVAVVLLIELLHRPIAWAIGAYNFSDPYLTQTSISLMRLALPAVLFMGVGSVFTSLLYAFQRFTIPAFLPAIFNASIVVVALLRPDHISSVVIGLLLGTFLQTAVQWPALRLARLRWNFDPRHPVIRRILKLYAPIVGGLVVNFAVITLSYNLANRTGDGSLNYMRRATTLIQFPMGLIVTAISIAILPTLARQAADLVTFRGTLASGLRLVIVLILPATVGLFVLAEPIVGLLFGHGKYTSADVLRTAEVLQLYLLGLPFAAVDQMLVFGSYARQDTWRPAVVGVISMIVNALVAISLLNLLGLFSLMLADVARHLVHTALMVWVLHRQIGGVGGHGVWPTTLKAALAALGTGAAAWWMMAVSADILPTGLTGELAGVVLAGGVGLLVWFLLARLLRIAELLDIIRLIRQRMGKRN
jgi:putative peptidoglycan lipid II flippase